MDLPVTPPVDPQATPAALRLLAALQSAHRAGLTLTGQHNQMPRMSVLSERLEQITGHYPIVWGGEWGFSDSRNDTDDVKYRPRLLAEIRRHWQIGCIPVLTWHQASPAVGEPCLFEGGVKTGFTDSQWEELFTEGSPLSHTWTVEVDRLASALKPLQADGIALVFRPYHEMNGDWFWWGGQPERFIRLWHLLRQRLIDHHHLHHLLWAWCSDRPWPGVERFFPGHHSVDLLGADIYPLPGRDEVFPQEWFDRMQALAAGKPLALTECGALPSAEQLARQPWTWFMGWDSLTFSQNSPECLQAVFHAPASRSFPWEGWQAPSPAPCPLF
jgi:mannan endo-1,4-beta-mannosidase